jgi:hypothetical protein
MKQQRSTLEKSGDAAGRPSWRSSLLDDPGAEFPKWKTRHMKNSLNVMSTCLKVVDMRRPFCNSAITRFQWLTSQGRISFLPIISQNGQW